MQLGMMFTVGLLALLATVDRPPLLAIYGLTAVASALSAIERPARTAMLPQLVPAGKLPAAFALRQLSFQTTLIVGPALAGLGDRIGWGGLGLRDRCCELLASLFVLRWLPRSLPERSRTNLRSIR